MMKTSLLTLSDFADRHSFSVRQLRWIDERARYDDDSEYSRFRPAFARIGRRVYVNEQKFLEAAMESP